jgi:hypothetical protein
MRLHAHRQRNSDKKGRKHRLPLGWKHARHDNASDRVKARRGIVDVE